LQRTQQWFEPAIFCYRGGGDGHQDIH
jgi:hypothetical protein